MISYFFGNLIDMYVIIAVILINSIISYVQESKTEHSIQALKKLIVSYAKVYRDGKLKKINSTLLVPGDIIYLEEGDRIPADARLLTIKNFRTNESSLTGESFPADKQIRNLSEKVSLGDQKNMVFMGTYVVLGNAKAIIVSTGSETAIGKVAKDIQKIPRTKPHFKEKTDFLAKQLGLLALFSAVFIFLIGYFVRGFEFSEIFLFTLASLVSVIPEGLPAVLAIVLAIGSYRMSKRNALIRNLPSTETLGIVTTIITDKTGTLTENTMNVESILISGYPLITVTGDGWKSEGKFLQGNKALSPLDNNHLAKLIHISALCNNSRILKEENEHEKYTIIGDPTEASLVVLSEKAGIQKDSLEKYKVDDIPFNSELKYRASLSTLINEKGKKQIYVVGAPENVLKNSASLLYKNKELTLDKSKLVELNKGITSLTKDGQRVLALAYRNVSNNMSNLKEEDVHDLIFVGIVGIRDPPRKGVKEAIERTKNAGIRVIMATGDHKETAVAIAKDIGLEVRGRAWTEEELEELSEREFSDVIKNNNIFARLTPNMKLKIATELQNQGEIVAMTGDGVNDAPALKKADIGISMGIIGTDVARESSDIILADDNFASIVNAIEEGRIVFINTRQTGSYLVTTNISEALTILISIAMSFPIPFLPIHILWLNLVTGGGTDVSLATEPSHEDVLNNKPRKASEQILSKEMIPFIFLISTTMILVTLFVFNLYFPSDLGKARTMAFGVLTFSELFNAYNMRSLKKSLFKIGIFSNKFVNYATLLSLILFFGILYIPFFQNIFSLVPLTLKDSLILVGLSSLVFIVGEAYKFVKK
ncbi:cation-transporting ATPase [Candidatus Pacearchaeota archaeon CG10_big_fil_rev_8_21_14_0_10_30_48]|nr:MAG: cation-transporting ATPase [Candidatus Pacearchaeota archaeon CG10_big_fil_rev_8_21_14_0_10_30_48]